MIKSLLLSLSTFALIFISTPSRAQNNWFSLSGPFDVEVRSITQDKAGTIYAASDTSVSRNGGSFWERASSLHTPADNKIRVIFMTSDGTLLQGNAYGLLKSVDRAQTWTPVAGVSGGVTSIMSSGMRILVGTETGLYTALDGLPFTLLRPGKVTAVHVATDGSLLVASNELVKIDNQLNSTTIDGTPDPINFITSDKHGDYFIGYSASGIGRVKPGETSVELVNGGLISTDILGLVATEGDSIFAATYKAGVFLSTNRGDSWVPYNDGVDTKNTTSLALTNSGFLFVGTDVDGIYRSDKQYSLPPDLPPSRVSVSNRALSLSFDPVTRTLRTAGAGATITVYDLLGRIVQVCMLRDRNEIQIDSKLYGAYFAQVKSGAMVETIKLLLSQ